MGSDVENGLEMFETTFEKAGVAIAHVSADGHWIRVNQCLCDFLGYTKEELLAKTFQEITFIDDLENDFAHAARLHSGESDGFSIEKRYIHKNGAPIWAELAATAIRDENGNIKYFIAIIKNIADQIALRENKKTLRYLLEASPIAVRIAKANGSNVIFANKAYSKLIQCDESEVLGKNPKNYYVYKSQYDEIVEQIKNKQTIYNKLIELEIKGSTVWGLSSYMPIEFDGEDCVIGWFYDITEQEKVKQSIEEMSANLQRGQIFLQTLLNSVPVPIFYKDMKGKFLGFNEPYLKLVGLKKEDVLGKTVFDFIPHEAASKYLEKDLELLANPNETQVYEYVAFNRDENKNHNVIFYKKVFFDENYNASGIIGAALDITAQREIEATLTHQKNELESIFNVSRDGIAILDLESNFLEVNDSYLKMTGFTREELFSKSCISLTLPEDMQRAQDALDSVLTNGYLESFEKTCVLKDNKRLIISMSVSMMPDKKRFLVSTKDITDMKKHEKQLEYIAHYDSLTGLPNRVLKSDRLRHEMLQIDRKGGHLAVVYLDLDGFKEVNDAYGHGVGDQLLMGVSLNMKNALRECDTLSRLGGDEFVAIISDMSDISTASPIINRLLEAASKPVLIEDKMIGVSASIGVSFYPQEDNVDGDQLIRQSDQAMYEAKQSGKNRYHIFDSIHDKNIRILHENLERIKQALYENEFELYYQPKVNMRTGDIVGAEALIRWNHPERGVVFPIEFLPLIEEHSLAVDIGEWVINSALMQIKEWYEVGFYLHISVNIGAKQLLQGNFMERLKLISSQYPHDIVSLLEMEILETSALEDVVSAANIVNECRSMGINFSLDDFGTGYSSLSYLKRIPVTTLKIDQSFVRDMLSNADDLAILKGIIGLADVFKRSVIAEGVETIEHGVCLLKLGCDLAQGYAIARPMPASMFLAWREKWINDSAIFLYPATAIK